MVVYTFNPALGWEKQADLFEFKVILVAIASSRLARATQQDLGKVQVDEGLGPSPGWTGA